MTQQEIFDKVKNHLLTQNAKAMKEGSCAYRAADGGMCAAGCLIEDDAYSPMLEFNSVGYGCVDRALKASGVGDECIPLVRSLQKVHDGFNVDEWSQELQKVAQEYGLVG